MYIETRAVVQLNRPPEGRPYLDFSVHVNVCKTLKIERDSALRLLDNSLDPCSWIYYQKLGFSGNSIQLCVLFATKARCLTAEISQMPTFRADCVDAIRPLSGLSHQQDLVILNQPAFFL